MNTNVLVTGEKVHVVFRRRFEGDLRRHFVGTILAVDGEVVRVEGHAFVYNTGNNEWERRPDKRNRIIPLNDADLVVNILPRDVDIETFYYALVDGHLVATDGTYTLDINEFSAKA